MAKKPPPFAKKDAKKGGKPNPFGDKQAPPFGAKTGQPKKTRRSPF